MSAREHRISRADFEHLRAAGGFSVVIDEEDGTVTTVAEASAAVVRWTIVDDQAAEQG